jgi:PAS domain-containing protein
MQEGVVLLGVDGCIRACNASAERILGLVFSDQNHRPEQR